MEKAYSTNGEDFTYDSADEALQALADDGELTEGRTYYEIETAPINLAEYLEADRALDSATDAIYDDVGEASEDAFYAGPAAIAEWNAFAAAWAEKHLSTRCWKCVGKSVELKVTAADVAEYAA